MIYILQVIIGFILIASGSIFYLKSIVVTKNLVRTEYKVLSCDQKTVLAHYIGEAEESYAVESKEGDK